MSGTKCQLDSDQMARSLATTSAGSLHQGDHKSAGSLHQGDHKNNAS